MEYSDYSIGDDEVRRGSTPPNGIFIRIIRRKIGLVINGIFKKFSGRNLYGKSGIFKENLGGVNFVYDIGSFMRISREIFIYRNGFFEKFPRGTCFR